ncbi:PLDc_N domain-containing protein [Bacillus aquiflavi]|uniref:PLDc_N domain-containing protein n=1 Tax=Bacillus aquiflavi TaxID=2672567 RepID=A0A6B3W0W8_9BACI|nr:PLD nuclease N-terminal domain-containing protein [Bacillus aquiflavi]MBA4537989.1 PLDc_N domain-containing protein [Bacillus aquiflavi]NEY82245.1 PLDc_N domain-containing protein [Bacillus aquiflavi]UAC49863.1 PLD nuclease N-terminal domain-containing protein [Bacillus aquiflavi]
MELLQSINWALLLPFVVIQFILLIIAIIDLVRSKNTNGPKWVWALVILCISIIGPIVYFIFGRRND